jgi:hypothetical protein
MSVDLYSCLSFPACKAHIFCAALSSVACPALPYFSALSHNRRDPRGKKAIEHKMCVFIFFTTLYEKCRILIRIWPRIVNIPSLQY